MNETQCTLTLGRSHPPSSSLTPVMKGSLRSSWLRNSSSTGFFRKCPSTFTGNLSVGSWKQKHSVQKMFSLRLKNISVKQGWKSYESSPMWEEEGHRGLSSSGSCSSPLCFQCYSQSNLPTSVSKQYDSFQHHGGVRNWGFLGFLNKDNQWVTFVIGKASSVISASIAAVPLSAIARWKRPSDSGERSC